MPTPTSPEPDGSTEYVAVSRGVRVVNVLVRVARLPCELAATAVTRYEVSGRRAPVERQRAPSCSKSPLTFLPPSSVTVTEVSRPPDAATTTGWSGRTEREPFFGLIRTLASATVAVVDALARDAVELVGGVCLAVRPGAWQAVSPRIVANASVPQVTAVRQPVGVGAMDRIMVLPRF
jgi:hypothetical protein